MTSIGSDAVDGAACAVAAAGDGAGVTLTEVTRQLREYVPLGFAAKLKVHFIFGSYSGGFAFEDDANNVCLARLSQASIVTLPE
jgi:hypothetical protein